MKKSRAIKFTVLNGIICTLGACGPAVIPVDPCNIHTFNPPACEMAISSRGYYYRSTWYPLSYTYPYSFYYEGYNSYIASGGRVYAVPSNYYSNQFVSSDMRAQQLASVTEAKSGTYMSTNTMRSFSAGRTGSTMSRGGFGSIGASHSSFGG
jgi:uncharacterized protein YgiB involved in biofilm formation